MINQLRIEALRKLESDLTACGEKEAAGIVAAQIERITNLDYNFGGVTQ